MPDQTQKYGEVIWPRLVARKLLRRPFGSSRFIADLPDIQTLFPLQSFNEQILRERSLNSHRDTVKYKIFASTWNVGGVMPSDDLCLDDWLDVENKSYDIYVLGFQEIVPLSAKNVLGPEKRWISNKWNSLIGDTLNKSTNKISNQGFKVKNAQEKNFQEKVASSMESSSSREFRCIITKQMVGIMTTVWIRDELLKFIHQPSVSCIGCGVMGCLGNKGAVSVRFFLHETSFCFVCCHLASGGKAADVQLRNTDVIDILTRTSFPRGSASLNLPCKILHHDRVVLLGDLNYRINLQEHETKALVEHRRWSTLLEKDQLRMEFMRGRIFQGWNEGLIIFSPTYKYYPNTDLYYGCAPGTKCDKKRAPAWCDRILWYGIGMKQIRYDRCESRLSDHRPVCAAFITEVNVKKSCSSLRDFLMSDKLDDYLEDFVGGEDNLFIKKCDKLVD